MANETNDTPAEVADKVLDEKPKFAGYTLDDLRYRRAVVALRKEFAREKLVEDYENVRHWSPFAQDGKGKKASKAATIARKLIGGLNYLDYAMIGLSLFSSARKVAGFFKPKK